MRKTERTKVRKNEPGFKKIRKCKNLKGGISQVLTASEATEGITFGEIFEQSWQNLTSIIDICHMPAVSFHVE